MSATITGSVIFYEVPNVTWEPQYIPSIPIILFNPLTTEGVIINTDSGGKFTITDVPTGNFQLIEAWGQTAQATQTISWNSRLSMTQTATILEKDPPLSYIHSARITVPSGTTHIVSSSPNTINISVTTDDSFLSYNFSDIGVIYHPVILEPYSIVGQNLITNIDSNGDFGMYDAGAAPHTSPTTNPYDFIPAESNFTYAQLKQGGTVADGQLTLTNLMDDQYYRNWHIMPDHTTGNERGRFLLVNGGYPGDNFYESNSIVVQKNTPYVFSLWATNINNYENSVLPQFKIEVIGNSGNTYYEQVIDQTNALLPISPTIAEWFQFGNNFTPTVDDQIQVILTSLGGNEEGDDFAFDDFHLFQIYRPPYVSFKKSSTPMLVRVGDSFTYTFIISNLGSTPIDHISIEDSLPDGVTFLSISSSSNSVSYGYGIITIQDSLAPSESLTITITTRAESSLINGQEVTNNAKLQYQSEGIIQPSLSASAQNIILNPTGRGVLFI